MDPRPSFGGPDPVPFWVPVAVGVVLVGLVAAGTLTLIGPRAAHGDVDHGHGVDHGSVSGAPRDAELRFVEVAAAAGLDMRHAPGRRERTLPEDTGSGLAWGDVDGDGDFDLYLVNYAGPETPEGGGGNRLYRNDGGLFTDITAAAGVADPEGFGLGASFADYDGDGDADLYVTNFGPNRLFRNEGDGTFVEVGAAAGVDHELLSTGVAWGDADRDGDLDLYVCNYVAWVPGDPDEMVVAEDEGVSMSIPITTDPYSYPPQHNAFYRNEGDGTFTDVAEELGISSPEGRSLEVVMVDLDGDGWLDLYVNNDLSTNRLYRNTGVGGEDLAFVDLSEMTGTADHRGSMGLGVGDFGGGGREVDGLPDLLLTHWFTESNALYRVSSRPGMELAFSDDAAALGLGEPSAPWVGWGTCVVDFDLDGDLDVMVANGSTTETEEDKYALIQEPILVFRGDGERFEEIGAAAGEVFAGRFGARGLAAADYDADGDVDVALNINHGAPLLLRNESSLAGGALSVRLDVPDVLAMGARVEVFVDGHRQVRWWSHDSSYLSGHAPERVFSLGGSETADEIQVYWADGTVSTWKDVHGPRFVGARP